MTVSQALKMSEFEGVRKTLTQYVMRHWLWHDLSILRQELSFIVSLHLQNQLICQLLEDRMSTKDPSDEQPAFLPVFH
jgi:hypothetical protein